MNRPWTLAVHIYHCSADPAPRGGFQKEATRRDRDGTAGETNMNQAATTHLFVTRALENSSDRDI
jgi:hypothetical protein